MIFPFHSKKIVYFTGPTIIKTDGTFNVMLVRDDDIFFLNKVLLSSTIMSFDFFFSKLNFQKKKKRERG